MFTGDQGELDWLMSDFEGGWLKLENGWLGSRLTGEGPVLEGLQR